MKILEIIQVLESFNICRSCGMTTEWLRKLSHYYLLFIDKIRYLIMCPVFERMQDSVSILNSLDL